MFCGSRLGDTLCGECIALGTISLCQRTKMTNEKPRERNTEFHYAFKEGKDAQGNFTASCKRLISWFLLYKETELGRKIVPVRPPKF
ncbi:hypothetical protein TNCV_4572481 [Trichonephila clavipes]|nr:hypothetical protein TNCV_4572481 [Trichonephila clavipes]